MALAEVTTPEWTFGDRLAKARRHAGMEQGDMAKALGVSRPTISTWERDESQPRHLFEVAQQWADLTGVELGWLLGAGSRTGSLSPLVGLPATLTPELPFPPRTRQLAAVGSG